MLARHVHISCVYVLTGAHNGSGGKKGRSGNCPRILIEFARFTHDGCVTKIRTGSVRNMRIYVRYHAPLALETMVRAGYHLGLDCPDGWKKAV